jgi:hypothetical protein
VDVRNRDELLKKKESLEAYLLENPQSTLFAWYARQNMEAGELYRALSICKMGLPNVDAKGVLHKLMGEIYLAKGEVTQSMKHLVECILTREPFPGVIIEVVKNLGDTMESDQIAFLVHLLNKALPGHKQATQFYKKYPSARNFKAQPGQYAFLEELAISLERSALVEVLPIDAEEDVTLALPSPVETKPEMQTNDSILEPREDVKVVHDTAPPFHEHDIPVSNAPLDELVLEPETLPESAPAPRQPVTRMPRQGPAVKHNITRSMATFTLMQIFKDQGMYENAMEVLIFLREKSSNSERIEQEEKEIRDLMARNGVK